MTFHGQHHIFWFDVTMEVTLRKLTGETGGKGKHLFMKELKRKNELCCMEGSSFLVKSFALKERKNEKVHV